MSFRSAFASSPVILSQVQTNNDAHFVKTRQRNMSTSGFEVALEEDQNQTQAHGPETIAWLAIEPGDGTWNGIAYDAQVTPDAVTHAWYPLSFPFSVGFDRARLIAGLASYDGDDNAALRFRNLTQTGVEVKIEEDTTCDSETGHTTEVVSYLAFMRSGTLTGGQLTGSGQPFERRYYLPAASGWRCAKTAPCFGC